MSSQQPLDCQSKPERERAGENANERKARGIDLCFFECGSAKQGVAGERNHRQQSKDENSSRFHIKAVLVLVA